LSLQTLAAEQWVAESRWRQRSRAFTLSRGTYKTK
jgi:hypothetical protein